MTLPSASSLPAAPLAGFGFFWRQSLRWDIEQVVFVNRLLNEGIKKQREMKGGKEKRLLFSSMWVPQWEAGAQSCWGPTERHASELSFQRQQAETLAISAHWFQASSRDIDSSVIPGYPDWGLHEPLWLWSNPWGRVRSVWRDAVMCTGNVYHSGNIK